MGLFGEGTGTGGGGGGNDGGGDDDGDDGGADDGGSGDSGDDDGGSDGDDGIRYDVEPDGTGGNLGDCDPETDPDCNCTMTDVLFVIDTSSTMCSWQTALAQAFPTFVDAMYDALPVGTDLHVAVATSGFGVGGSHGESNCVPNEPYETLDEYYARPTEETLDGNGLQGRLFEWEGKRYYEVMTDDLAAKDGLKDWFAGAATATGCLTAMFEFNASGAAWALHSANDATNAGFLRDEGAVLVIFVLSDEAGHSYEMETHEFLHDTISQAKSGCGGDNCIVSGGLLTNWCTGDQNGAFRLLSSFGEDPVVGDISNGATYTEVVGDALAQVAAQACDEIPPPP